MKFKIIIKSFIIAILLIVIVSGSSAYNVSAKGLSKIELEVGQSQKLQVRTNLFGTVSWKKVKWSSNNKRVATVSKKGLVKAKKKGKATITAKYGKKKLKCKVVVRAKKKVKPITTNSPIIDNGQNGTVVSNSELASKINVSALVLPDKTVLFTLVNNNAVNVKYCNINYQLKTTTGAVVDTSTTTGYFLAPGETQYKSVYVGSGSEQIDVTASVFSVTVENGSYYKDVTSFITVSDAPTLDGIGTSITYVNGYNKNVNIYATILFYDAAGNIVASENEWNYPSAGETRMETVNGPYEYDDNYERVPKFASYKIFYKAYSYE